MKKIDSKYFVTVNNKKYFYTLRNVDKKSIFVQCDAANIGQEFLKEDVADLLIDLPNLILAEKEYKSGQGEIIRFRLEAEDKKAILLKAQKNGYKTVSAFLRHLALGA
jgi:hypothetical protein